jgi:hypothetical protein
MYEGHGHGVSAAMSYKEDFQNFERLRVLREAA